MAGNNDTAKVFISFAGKSITGLADRPKLAERPSRVSTTFGCQGYSESQQEYEGDRSVTLSVFRTGDGYKYLQVTYPEGCKDVQEMTAEQIKEMFSNCTGKRKLRRI